MCRMYFEGRAENMFWDKSGDREVEGEIEVFVLGHWENRVPFMI